MTFVIIDLSLSGIRIILGLLGIVAPQAIEPGNPLYPTVPFELTANISIGAFGILAGVLLLCKEASGVIFGWLKVVLAVFGLGVAAWQIVLMTGSEGAGQDSAEALGDTIFAGALLLVCAALLVCYAIAVSKAAKVIKARKAYYAAARGLGSATVQEFPELG